MSRFCSPVCSGGPLLGVLVVAFMLPPPSRATPSPGTYTACMKEARSTRDMQACQAAAVADANGRLAVALTQALRGLPPDRRAKLRAAQGRWSAFRRSDCGAFYGKATGTLATIAGGQCMIDRTQDRIKQLRDLLPSEGH